MYAPLFCTLPLEMAVIVIEPLHTARGISQTDQITSESFRNPWNYTPKWVI